MHSVDGRTPLLLLLCSCLIDAAAPATILDVYRDKPDAEIIRAAHCASAASRRAQDSLWHEDLDLLVLLLGLRADGSPGTFIEIGGADGIHGSQTFMIERCFNWRGLMFEAHPTAFGEMNRSGRVAHKVHAAGCKAGGSVTVPMGIYSTGVSAVLEMIPQGCKKSMTPILKGTTPVEVPCRELSEVVRNELHWDRVDFASVDVQGAEDKVLETLDLTTTQVIFVEAEGCAEEKNKRVRKMLLDAGYVRLPLMQKIRTGMAAFNELYAKPEVADYRPWYVNGTRSDKRRTPTDKLKQAMEGLRGGLARRCSVPGCMPHAGGGGNQ